MEAGVDLLTRRLRLRPLSAEDEPAVMAYRGDAHASRYLGHSPLADGQYLPWLAERAGEGELREPGHRRFYGIEVRASRALVGDAVLILSADGQQGEIGMFLHPDTAGLGYSLEAGSALLDVAFGTLGLHRIVGRAAAHNRGSIHAMERMGLRREALFLASERRGETWIDCAVYAILAEEWKRRQHPSPPTC
ncbi:MULTISPECIES: GNAT family N-acetyltransferase [unclassified Rathayibacter]|uniref:GNAT family N-acetyltransferase n=1 Tax=unclassified Rathayibacter TaxID=2609250 RepID=UPI00188C38C4|nr:MULTISPECIES: GNAT family protein [unclassified Rathayibacter]MBF4461231.1 GNAT family N-acetyltransferase [Rathayibacter sp. VKM Ac-2879]MBF4502642.1 GNAT family N-acetyltransferase [Rathayibacter sp. VKM Ac-2878]